MGWYEKKGEINVNKPEGAVTFSKVSKYVKQLINASRIDYHESEAFEVTEIVKPSSTDYGAVLGIFVNQKNQKVKGKRSVVKPLMPHITNIPLIGEHVVVVEYQGQHYYTCIINKKNSPNENSIPGVVSAYEDNTKYGKTFERKDIRRVEVNEGDIVYEGRFGNSIKLGCDNTNNSPNIKIRVGQSNTPETPALPVKENIEGDGSSIYLLQNGLPYDGDSDREKFDGDVIEGKKILIKSDGIFISGRSNIKFRAVNDINITTPVFNIISADGKPDIKLGSTADLDLQPLVRGDDLKSLLEDLTNTIVSRVSLGFETGIALIPPTAPAGGAPSIAPFKLAMETLKVELKTKFATKNFLSDKVKTV